MDARLNISNVLKQGLAALSMYNTDNNSYKSGLKFVSNYRNEINNYIKLHLLEAKEYGADAVYFKYFENGRPPIPQIYIYEDSKLEQDINKLHKELWSSCKVPMFFIFSNTKINIFNSLSKKEIDKQSISPIKVLDIAAEIQDEFKAHMFDSGEFWNTVFAKKEFSYKYSAYNSLLDSLEIARDDLVVNQQKSISIINSLLIKSILLRYMEERGVFKGFFQQFLPNAESFKDICDSEKVMIEVFDYLSDHFNGGIFKLSDSEKDEIKNINLRKFKFFIKGDVTQNNGQMHFWDLYSFKDLPVELISNIYELFLKAEDKKGVVYTPPILVNFMIDEMMPLDTPKENFRILDPASGSGIFLVGAYKRLIQWWMIKNNLEIPPVNVLKSLLRENIYGIDIAEEAIEVAKFSLSLSICDVLSPEAIWNQLHFDDLSKTKNLIVNDFFEVIDNKENYDKIKDFDLIIGNPPFIEELGTDTAKNIDKQSFSDNSIRPKLPAKQLAYLFLEQSFKLLKQDAFISLVQPSSFLYNNQVEPFRKYILGKFNLRQVIDFTGLNKLYNGSKKDSKGKKVSIDVPTIVLCFEKNRANLDKNEILHLTVRQTFESKEKLYFDLSYYDFHWILYQDALCNKLIWKCNLLGGNRVVDIVNRLNQYPTLASFLKRKVSEKNWQYSEGYILGNKRNNTPWLHNHLALLPKATPLTKRGIDWDKTYYIDEKSFEAPRNKELFTAPLIIIREVLDKETILLDYSDKDVAFTNRFVGISAPSSDKNELKEIAKTLKDYSKEYIFYIIATSSQVGVGMATAMLKSDIDILPWSQDISNNFRFSKTEQYFADDTINYMLDWINGKQNLPIFKNASEKQLEEYQEVYCEVLNSVYKKFKPYQYISTSQFIIMSFYYKDYPKSKLFDDDLNDESIENLINNRIGKNINITRVFKYYDKNIVYIIKPKQYRFWMKSIAARDADETFSDLIEMRY